MNRIKSIEQTLIWAKQQGYTFADSAAADYAQATQTVWERRQAYYNLYGFRGVDEPAQGEAALKGYDQATEFDQC